jgi:hypothetical protein
MRTDGQTDRHDEANSRFSQFRERAQYLLTLVSSFDNLKNVQVTAILHGLALCQEANRSFSQQKPNAYLKVVSVGFMADKVELGLYYLLVA